MIISRFVFPAIAGGAVVVGLGHLMVKLIHVEFEAEPEKELVVFEPADIIAMPPSALLKPKPPERKADVEIPPAIVPISNEKLDGPPSEPAPGPLKPVPIPKPPIDIPRVDTASIDKNAKPIRRFVAKVPEKALRAGVSGHCLMRFDVDSLGRPFNVNAYHCSHNMFETNSVNATKKFKYLPRYKNGTPVDMHGVETKITYKVFDEKGKLLPES